MTNIKKTLVKPKDLGFVWPFIEKLLNKSIKRSYGRTSTDDLLQECLYGESHLWIFYEEDKYPEILGCGITQINDYPSGLRMLNIDHLAGNHHDKWTQEGLRFVEEFAKDANCDGIEALGRPGFWNWLKDENYDKIAVAYQKRFLN
jgi:hypothetical protein|tara:strand:- start:1563 stop:2000 length:438 start_codon:yes stop_codon:yes gene_type:complete